MRYLRFESRLVRYLLTGGTAYGIEMSTLWILKHIGLSNIESVAISFWTGLITAFLLQKYITFQDTRQDHKVITKQIIFYSILVVFNYLFTLIAFRILESVIGVYILRTLLIALTTVWNYLIYRLIFDSDDRLS
jgi:putative flippase GtrA